MTKKATLDTKKDKFWEEMSDEEIVRFQLFESKLQIPFDIFHKAIEKILKRPVFTIELTSENIKRLQKEYLGEIQPPTLNEIFDTIPDEKKFCILIPKT